MVIIASLFVFVHSVPIGNLVLVYAEQNSAAELHRYTSNHLAGGSMKGNDI